MVVGADMAMEMVRTAESESLQETVIPDVAS